jgi:hypothetical protein
VAGALVALTVGLPELLELLEVVLLQAAATSIRPATAPVTSTE